jgi:hypothetical protein
MDPPIFVAGMAMTDFIESMETYMANVNKEKYGTIVDLLNSLFKMDHQSLTEFEIPMRLIEKVDMRGYTGINLIINPDALGDGNMETIKRIMDSIDYYIMTKTVDGASIMSFRKCQRIIR